MTGVAPAIRTAAAPALNARAHPAIAIALKLLIYGASPRRDQTNAGLGRWQYTACAVKAAPLHDPMTATIWQAPQVLRGCGPARG
jgi:hypothetical protein